MHITNKNIPYTCKYKFLSKNSNFFFFSKRFKLTLCYFVNIFWYYIIYIIRVIKLEKSTIHTVTALHPLLRDILINLLYSKSVIYIPFPFQSIDQTQLLGETVHASMDHATRPWSQLRRWDEQVSYVHRDRYII